jgi:hypothetical protein
METSLSEPLLEIAKQETHALQTLPLTQTDSRILAREAHNKRLPIRTAILSQVVVFSVVHHSSNNNSSSNNSSSSNNNSSNNQINKGDSLLENNDKRISENLLL